MEVKQWNKSDINKKDLNRFLCKYLMKFVLSGEHNITLSTKAKAELIRRAPELLPKTLKFVIMSQSKDLLEGVLAVLSDDQIHEIALSPAKDILLKLMTNLDERGWRKEYKRDSDKLLKHIPFFLEHLELFGEGDYNFIETFLEKYPEFCKKEILLANEHITCTAMSIARSWNRDKFEQFLTPSVLVEVIHKYPRAAENCQTNGFLEHISQGRIKIELVKDGI